MHSFLPKRQYTVGFCFYLVCLLTDFLSQFSLHPAVLPVNRRRLFRLGDLGQPRRYLRHGGREYAATLVLRSIHRIGKRLIHCKGIAHSLKFPCCVSSCTVSTVIVRVRPIPYIIIRNRRISAESFNFSHCQLVHIGIIEDGELVWPLPGHTYISCNSGESDAYGNPGHRGTVVISGWNDSYGNQVLLDNGAGLS